MAFRILFTFSLLISLLVLVYIYIAENHCTAEISWFHNVIPFKKVDFFSFFYLYVVINYFVKRKTMLFLFKIEMMNYLIYIYIYIYTLQIEEVDMKKV